jgi:hypothetical protein
MKLLIGQHSSILLLFHPSLVQIFSLESCSQTPSVYALPLIRKTKFHTRTNKWQNYGSVYLNLYVLDSKREDKRHCIACFLMILASCFGVNPD